MVSVAVIAAVSGANAAQNARDNAQGSQSGRVGMMAARMPTIPTSGITTIGNPAVTVTDQPTQNVLPNVVPTPNPTPTPNPNPEPTPTPDCDDGGVRNSEYTIDMCMNDLLQCVNTGALQGGLNDLFNADVRNAVMNGMMLCQNVVDKCVREVRIDCHNVYAMSSDVWLDFNSRIIQPEYYNFVLRKTGLTPNQAENTCLLLDRNTYGESFASVSDHNDVNTEYNNRVGAYNGAEGGTLSKNNPQGVAVNTVGYDGNRGHYARWDAVNAECLIRVAAYNKDELIKNNWLWGAMGNDEPAEVWQKAGSTFTCNKNLFDMSSLLNDTRTAAVVAVPGGTLLGAGIGAGIGAANYDAKQKAYNDPCSDKGFRTKLGAKIYASNKGGVLRSYAYKNVTLDNNGVFNGTPIFSSGDNFNEMTEEQCRDLHDLNEKVYLYQSYVDECLKNESNRKISQNISARISNNQAVNRHMSLVNGNGSIQITETLTCDASGVTQNEVATYSNACLFKPLRDGASGVLCESDDKCLSVSQIQHQIDELRVLLRSLTPELNAPDATTKGKEVAKGALIGATTGAGVGGIVTGITALVERSNITCKVGDGLNTVALGKSHTIDSLKDFYVKWNLHLPDVVSPTSAVSDLISWQQACRQFNNRLNDCPNVQINFVHGNTYDLVQSACVVSGSICIVNDAVAQSHGIQ